MGKRLGQKEIIKALYDNHGILAAAAKNLGITRQTIYNRMKDNPKIEAAYKDANEENIDITESKLFGNIEKGHQSSIFYYLNNKARDRGYGKPILIAPVDPTGTKEYGADSRAAILGILLPELTQEDKGEEISETD